MSTIEASNKIRNRAAWISAIASILIFLLKAGAYKMTGSAAILSDALESTVNVLASLVALAVIRVAARPADHDHPYGHGKAEFFSSAFEGGMIFFAALMIIVQSVRALISGEPAHQLEDGMIIVAVAAILNLVLGLYLKNIGTKYQSDALKASGAHVLSDVWTTAGVIVGLGLVLVTKLSWLDPAIAIFVGLQLAYSGFKIVRESTGGLMDEQDTAVIHDLAQSLEKNRTAGIINIHKLRVIRSGRFHHVDAHLVVPEYWDVAHVHDVTEAFEEGVVRDYEFDGELAFHLDPCKKSYCSSCEVPVCPIRERPFVEREAFTLKSLTDDPRATNQGAYDNSRSTQTT